MSTAVLPSLAGLSIDLQRTAIWNTNVQQAVSGKEARIAYMPYPRWQWQLTFNLLRSAATYNELQQLAGFFNARQGKFDTFLYQDADDNSVTSQAIGEGDGVTTSFQLVRTFGGFSEPVLAPNTVNAVYLNGVSQGAAGGSWNFTRWGNSPPGTIVFNTPPASGAVITADFSYYFPVRMDDDKILFQTIVPGMYENKKFTFISVLN